MKKNKLSTLALAVCAISPILSFSQSWSLSGNTITSGQYLGVNNNVVLEFRRNSNTVLSFDENDNINLGRNNYLPTDFSNSVAIGNDLMIYNQDQTENIFAFGRHIYLQGAAHGGGPSRGAITLGVGISPSYRLVGENEGFSVGFYSTVPTFYVSPANGTVGSTGNVGIATTTPAQKLDVNGGIKLGNTTVASNGSLRYNNNDFEGYANGNWVSLTRNDWTSNGNNIYSNNTGNVGIGNTIPSEKLDIQGAVKVNGYPIYFLAGSYDPYYFMSAGEWNTGMEYQHFSGHRFFTGAKVERMRINDNGLVGINTNSPSQRLDVNGGIKISTTSTASDGSIRYHNNDFEGYMNGNWTSFTSSNWTKNGSHLYSNNTGDVAIGTLTPENTEGWDKSFNVNGNEHSQIIATTNVEGVKTGLWAHSSGFYGAVTGGMTGTKSNHPFSIVTNGYSRFTINSTGFVGIGTNTPAYKLHLYDGAFVITNSSGTNVFKADANGYVRARQVDVNLDVIPDYVFDEKYKLLSINELEQFVSNQKHLPNIKSAAEYSEAGSINLGELNLKLLEKVEELSLYIIELNKRILELEKQNASK